MSYVPYMIKVGTCNSEIAWEGLNCIQVIKYVSSNWLKRFENIRGIFSTLDPFLKVAIKLLKTPYIVLFN